MANEGGDLGRFAARQQLRLGKVAKFQQQIVNVVGMARAVFGFERLQTGFDLVEGGGVE